MHPSLIDFDELRRVSRLGPRATLARVERWAKRVGFPYKYDGQGGIFTTLDAMNASLGIGAPAANDGGAYSPDMAVY